MGHDHDHDAVSLPLHFPSPRRETAQGTAVKIRPLHMACEQSIRNHLSIERGWGVQSPERLLCDTLRLMLGPSCMLCLNVRLCALRVCLWPTPEPEVDRSRFRRSRLASSPTTLIIRAWHNTIDIYAVSDR